MELKVGMKYYFSESLKKKGFYDTIVKVDLSSNIVTVENSSEPGRLYEYNIHSIVLRIKSLGLHNKWIIKYG